MISLLARIVDMFVCWVQTGIVSALNWVIAAAGAVWGAIVDELPDMPGYPDLPSHAETAFAYMNWAFPMVWLLNYATIIAGLWLAYAIVAPIFRWIKAVD